MRGRKEWLLLLGCSLLVTVAYPATATAAVQAVGGAVASRRLLQATNDGADGRLAPAPALEADDLLAPAPALDADELLAPAPAPEVEGSCQSALNYSSVFMPLQAQFAFRMYWNGTRNYTCATFTLSFGPAMAFANATGDYNCLIYYKSPFLGIGDCSDLITGKPVGKVILDTTVEGAVFVMPSPINPSNEPWGRFKVTTDGDLPRANYAVRYNTSGGQLPAQCTAPRDEWVTVPFTNTIDLYWCP